MSCAVIIASLPGSRDVARPYPFLRARVALLSIVCVLAGISATIQLSSDHEQTPRDVRPINQIDMALSDKLDGSSDNYDNQYIKATSGRQDFISNDEHEEPSSESEERGQLRSLSVRSVPNVSRSREDDTYQSRRISLKEDVLSENDDESIGDKIIRQSGASCGVDNDDYSASSEAKSKSMSPEDLELAAMLAQHYSLDDRLTMTDSKPGTLLTLPRPTNVTVLIISWYPPVLKLSWNLNELSESDSNKLNFYEKLQVASDNKTDRELTEDFDLELAIRNSDAISSSVISSGGVSKSTSLIAEPQNRQRASGGEQMANKPKHQEQSQSKKSLNGEKHPQKGNKDETSVSHDNISSNAVDDNDEERLFIERLRQRRLLISRSLTCFKVTYNTVNSRFKISEEYPPYLRSILLERLIPATEYSLRVVAVYLGKYKLASERVSFISPTDNESRRFKESSYRPIHRYPDVKPSELRYGLGQVRGEELTIVAIAVMFWLATIYLFFNKWGKIRMLEPYQPAYREPAASFTTATSTHQHSSTHQLAASLTGVSLAGVATGTGSGTPGSAAGVAARGKLVAGASLTSNGCEPSSQPQQAQVSGEHKLSVSSASGGQTAPTSGLRSIQTLTQQETAGSASLTAREPLGELRVASPGSALNRKLHRAGALLGAARHFETIRASAEEALRPTGLPIRRTDSEMNFLYHKKVMALAKATKAWTRMQQQQAQRQEQSRAHLLSSRAITSLRSQASEEPSDRSMGSETRSLMAANWRASRGYSAAERDRSAEGELTEGASLGALLSAPQANGGPRSQQVGRNNQGTPIERRASRSSQAVSQAVGQTSQVNRASRPGAGWSRYGVSELDQSPLDDAQEPSDGAGAADERTEASANRLRRLMFVRRSRHQQQVGGSSSSTSTLLVANQRQASSDTSTSGTSRTVGCSEWAVPALCSELSGSVGAGAGAGTGAGARHHILIEPPSPPGARRVGGRGTCGHSPVAMELERSGPSELGVARDQRPLARGAGRRAQEAGACWRSQSHWQLRLDKQPAPPGLFGSSLGLSWAGEASELGVDNEPFVRLASAHEASSVRRRSQAAAGAQLCAECQRMVLRHSCGLLHAHQQLVPQLTMSEQQQQHAEQDAHVFEADGESPATEGARIGSSVFEELARREPRHSFAMLHALSQKKSKSAEDVAYLSRLVLRIWSRDRNPLLQSASQQVLAKRRHTHSTGHSLVERHPTEVSQANQGVSTTRSSTLTVNK